MKGNQKIKRIKLTLEDNNDYILLGIVSAEPDYKVSLSLNRKLGIALSNCQPVVISDENDRKTEFSRFSDAGSTPGIIYNLISNRSDKNYLLKKLKNIDYIFQIPDPRLTDNKNEIITRIRQIKIVTAVFDIDLNKLKDKSILHTIQ